MTKKIDALKKLKEYIENDQNIYCAYSEKVMQPNGEAKECYCSVGFVMKEYGFKFDDNFVDSGYNGNFISMVWKQFTLEELLEGFTLDELNEIQDLNDSENKEELLEYIDSLIVGCDSQ